MRLAVIDLGTNSVRFDVQEIAKDGNVRRLHREKLMIRLGQGVFLDGKLDPGAIKRAVHAFASFKHTVHSLRVDRIIAFGTSALREAVDGDKLLKRIRKSTGIDVRVISGEEEANLIAAGVMANEKALKGRYALVDIGGGSTEISICDGKKVLHSASFPIGTARLQQVFLKSSPPGRMPSGTDPIESLRAYVSGVLGARLKDEKWTSAPKIVGSSGTIRALSRMLSDAGDPGAFQRKDLSKLVKRMSGMTGAQLMRIPGMEAKRVDMILAGALLFEEVMKALGAKQARTTEYSLRDGILDEEVRMVKQHKTSHMAFHVPDLFAKAKRMGSSERHLKQVVAVSEKLFDELRPVHRLKPGWKLYLTAAAILHDVGEAVCPTRHELHSYYIVKNADFPSMEPWESLFVANLCLLHPGGKVTRKDLEFLAGRGPEARSAFIKLLAMLRIADALDRAHRGAVAIRKVEVTRKSVSLVLESKDSIDLELLRLEQKKGLFEQVFGRELLARA